MREAIARYRFRNGERPAARYVTPEDLATLERELCLHAYKPGQIKRDGLLLDQIDIDGVPVRPTTVFTGA